MSADWAAQADAAQAVLREAFWLESDHLFHPYFPFKPHDGPFHYWWQAHAMDALLDGYERTRETHYLQTAEQLLGGILRRNGSLTNDYYDDMEWLALALLRAYDLSQREVFKSGCLELWRDIQGGWSAEMGGGIAWRKPQLDYKNTPANAPAVILAARLYGRFGDETDLEWAHKIWAWQSANLIDPNSGLVWDGINRQSDGVTDKDWTFTYNQGVVIGAAVELWRITGEQAFLTQAQQTLKTALMRFAAHDGPTLRDEGGGDAGLFKGILVRYAVQLAEAVVVGKAEIADMLSRNARTLLEHSRPNHPFGSDWAKTPPAETELSAHLSGVMLLEAVARLKAR